MIASRKRDSSATGRQPNFPIRKCLCSIFRGLMGIPLTTFAIGLFLAASGWAVRTFWGCGGKGFAQILSALAVRVQDGGPSFLSRGATTARFPWRQRGETESTRIESLEEATANTCCHPSGVFLSHFHPTSGSRPRLHAAATPWLKSEQERPMLFRG
jgi:hypothetical protein